MSSNAAGFGKWEFFTIAVVILFVGAVADAVWNLGILAGFARAAADLWGAVTP